MADAKVEVGEGGDEVGVAVLEIDGDGEPEAEFAESDGARHEVDAVEVAGGDVPSEGVGVVMEGGAMGEGEASAEEEIKRADEEGAGADSRVKEADGGEGGVEVSSEGGGEGLGVAVVKEADEGVAPAGGRPVIGGLSGGEPGDEGVADHAMDDMARGVEAAGAGAGMGVHEGFEDVAEHGGVEARLGGIQWGIGFVGGKVVALEEAFGDV